MQLLWITVWALLTVMVDVSLSRVAFGALVPSLRSDLGVDLAAVGTVSAANAVGYLITSALAPWIERYGGMRQIAVVAHLVTAAGFIGAAFSPSVLLLVLARGVSGLGSGVGMVAALRLALDAAEPSRRVLVSTLAWSGGGLGLIIAAFAQPWLHAPLSWRIASLVCAAFALLVAAGTPAHEHANPVAATPSSAPAPWRWQGASLILVAYYLFGAGFLAYSTFAGVAPSHLSPFVRFLTIGLSAIVGSALVSRVRRPERAMAAAMFVGAIGTLLTIEGSFFGDIFFGLGLTAVAGLATAILRERAGVAAATRALALSTIAVGAGQFSGPLLAGAAAQHFGIVWAPGIAGVAYAAGFMVICADEWTRARTPSALVPQPQ